ncbi:factor H binding protein domain-containing protein, partial [Rodentibacter ratti]|uniref:factor H binding protein domain-containing protein n=1 Tax=Rodentibacter ratti TaxID=1906745 RepID=UPI00351D4082
AVKNAEAATAAEQAKAQAAAEKAAQDIAKAQQAVKNAEAATAAEQAKAQAAAEKAAQDLAAAQQAVKNAEAATAAEQAKAQAAANKAAQDLAAAQQAVKDAEAATAAEQAKAQAAAEKAAQDLAAAQQAVKNAEAVTAAEQAKAQAAANQAAQDLAAAQQAVKNAEAATAAEQAKAQAAAEKAAQDLAAAQAQIVELEAELAPVRAEAERKRIAAIEEQRKFEVLAKNAWRKLDSNNTSDKTVRSGGFFLDGNPFPLWDKVSGVNFGNEISDTVQQSSHLVKSDQGNAPAYYTAQNRYIFHVVTAHYINQQYSTYANWDINDYAVTEKTPSGYMARGQAYIETSPFYVALPTDPSYLDRAAGITATYKGKAIYKRSSSMGDFSLTADFDKGTVEGAITGGGSYALTLEKGKIKQSDNQIKFSGGVIITDNSSSYGSYDGIFAGPNAEEVVGTTTRPTSTREEISFGGKRQP